MKKSNMKASSLRSIMVVFLLLAIGLSAYGFYLTQGQLNDFAISVGQVVSKSTASSTSSQGISQLQTALSERQTTIDKTNAFTVSSQDYQTQAFNDLTKYATDAGVLISDYNVSTTTTTDARLSYVTIKFNNPVQTSSLIKFLKLIETNLPKMQVSGITLTDNPSTVGTVNVDPLTIGVYTK